MFVTGFLLTQATHEWRAGFYAMKADGSWHFSADGVNYAPSAKMTKADLQSIEAASAAKK